MYPVFTILDQGGDGGWSRPRVCSCPDTDQRSSFCKYTYNWPH